MKKNLLILLVFASAIPASAKVFVYNWTCKEVCYKYYENDMWRESYKGRGYLVIDTAGDSATATFVEFRSRKTNGTTQKEMWRWDLTLSAASAAIDNKTFTILSTGNSASRIFLTGEVKKGIVTKFTGSEIFNEDYGGGYLGKGTTEWTCSINKKWSALADGVGFDSTQAVGFVGDELAKLGYVWQ